MTFFDKEVRVAAYSDVVHTYQQSGLGDEVRPAHVAPAQLYANRLSQAVSDLHGLAKDIIKSGRVEASVISITGGMVVVEERLIMGGIPIGKWHPSETESPLDIPSLFERLDP
jgi:hypothetical protein